MTRRTVVALFVMMLMPLSVQAGVTETATVAGTERAAVSVSSTGVQGVKVQPAVADANVDRQKQVVADTEGVKSAPVEAAKLSRVGRSDDAVPGATTSAATDRTVFAQAGEGGIPSTPAGEGLNKPETSHDEATANEYPAEEEAPKISDPLEPWNRAMFTFNDKLYFWVLKPVAQGYNYVAPQPVRVAMRNLFSNAAAPVRFVNALLQLKFRVAGTELARFGLNTTFGLAGLFDVAEDQFNLYGQNEDLGQTLGSYGVGSGVYIVWPVFGPSSLRDTVGLVGDGFLNPLNYISPTAAMFGVRSYETVNKTSLSIGEYEDLKAAAVDPYVSVRDAYVQHRNYLIKE